MISPRVAPGLLSWPAWECLREADTVLGADVEDDWIDALAGAGVALSDVGALPVGERAGTLLDAATGPTGAETRTAVWLGSPDGDPGLTDALAEHVARRAVAGRPPQLELIAAAHDVPGSRLLDVVALMDRLRSPGGCPWDAEQTHTSLLPYLLEETHEVIEAVELGDRAHLREELGDLLLQVAFHARLAAEHESDPFDVDDVAAGIVDKLIRRHPHVFGDEAGGPDEAGDAAPARTTADLEVTWERLKASEKRRTGRFEGIPSSLPALARAQKMLGRLGNDPVVAPVVAIDLASGPDALARELLELVVRAGEQGQDAEAVLRAALTRLAGADLPSA